MAKRKGQNSDVNKSDIIRAILKEDPKIPVKGIISKAGEQAGRTHQTRPRRCHIFAIIRQSRLFCGFDDA